MRRLWAPAVCTIAAALYLSPIVHSGLADSDLLTAHLRAIASADGLSFVDALRISMNRFALIDGGFTPLRTIPVSLWFLAETLSFAKSLQLVLILVNVATFTVVCRQIFRSDAGTLLAIAITIAAWQLRFPHDPTLGSSFQWPWTCEFILLALIAMLQYSTRRYWALLALCLVCSAVAVFSSPYAWPTVALCGLAAFITIMRIDGISLGIALIILAGIAVFAGTRPDRSPQVEPWRQSHYALRYVEQVVAAVPTAYRALGNVDHDGPSDNSGDTRFENLPNVTFDGWIAIIVLSLIAYSGTRMSLSEHSANRISVSASIALALWFGAAVAIGPAAYWRDHIPWGQSYEVVYLEQFGVGLIGAECIMAIGRNKRAAGELYPLGIALLVFFITFGNVRANAFAVATLGRHDLTRSLVERAGADGLFSSIPIGSTIILPPDSRLFDPQYGSPSDARYALYEYAGRRFKTVPQSFLESQAKECASHGIPDCNLSESSIFALSAMKAELFHPQVALSQIYAIRNGEPLSIIGHGFAAFPDPASADAVATLLQSHQPGVRYTIPIKVESAAIVFTASRTCGAVPLDALFLAAVPSIDWGAGFYPAPTQGATPFEEADNAPFRGREPLFRWGGPQAALVVRRAECPPRPLDVTFAVVTSEPGLVRIHWPGGSTSIRTGSQIRTQVSLQIDENARSPILISLETDAAPFAEERMLIRKNADSPEDRRMLVATPVVGEVLDEPLDPSLNPTGGLH